MLLCYRAMTEPSVAKLLDEIERVKAEMKLKDVLISELYMRHIDQRQEMKQEYFVQRRLLEQKHEEEVVRIESDILRIKADTDSLERQLGELMTDDQEIEDEDNDIDSSSPPSLTLPCPPCPVCTNLMMPPVHIYQGT